MRNVGMTIDDILMLAKEGNATQKAKAFNEVVDFLMGKLFTARESALREAESVVASRLQRLNRLEQALASCGYTQPPTAQG